MANESRACIFNIQKFSIHDGPGIRTTVFFKGCPLRCAWCANPESIRPGVQVLCDSAKCVACGACAGVCPVGAIGVDACGAAVAHERCVGCGQCVAACPNAALSLSGKTYGIDEVLAVCLQDKDFYDESGGGVTLSGGEVMLQPVFARELLHRLAEQGVHTALETNGCVGPEVFKDVALATNLLLFDVKHHDADRHRRGTGVDNGVILENLRWAVAAGKQVLARIPVIPGYNDSLEDAAAFARLLRNLPLDTVQLLPFHQFGQNKYRMLGMDYTLDSTPQLHKEDLGEYRDCMLGAGMREVIL